MSSSLVSMGRLRSLLRNSVKDTFPEPSASRMEKLGHGARAGGVLEVREVAFLQAFPPRPAHRSSARASWEGFSSKSSSTSEAMTVRNSSRDTSPEPSASISCLWTTTWGKRRQVT